MSKHHNNANKRWTIKPDGRVDDIPQSSDEPLSIRAGWKTEAETTFLRMARNVLFFKPQLHIRGGAFLLIYHDGNCFCADSGPLDTSMAPIFQNKHPTLAAAVEDADFKLCATWNDEPVAAVIAPVAAAPVSAPVLHTVPADMSSAAAEVTSSPRPYAFHPPPLVSPVI